MVCERNFHVRKNITIDVESRCVCRFLLDYDGQYCHKLCIYHTYEANCVNACWYAINVHNTLYPVNMPSSLNNTMDIVSPKTRARIIEMEDIKNQYQCQDLVNIPPCLEFIIPRVMMTLRLHRQKC